VNHEETRVRGFLGVGLACAGHWPTPLAELKAESTRRAATRKILIAGGGYGAAFIRCMAELTRKFA
jgi:hypothetical protein